MTKQDNPVTILVEFPIEAQALQEIQSISPRIHIKKVSLEDKDTIWEEGEILLTDGRLPQIEQVPQLRWIQSLSAGMDNLIKSDLVKNSNVTVTSASGIHANNMANIAIMLILAFHYGLRKHIDHQAQALWPANRNVLFSPADISDKTIGIHGYGHIGREIGRLASALGMRVVASKKNLKNLVLEDSSDPECEIPDLLFPSEAIVTMAEQCDYLVSVAPLTKESFHSIDKPVFAAMPESGIFINLGRGKVVNEADLIEALENEVIAGAGLDVFETEPLPEDSPLWEMENVYVMPHVSGNSDQYNQKALQIFKDNLRLYLDGKPLNNQLNRDTGY